MKQKVALFDVCHTLVSVTTITDFTKQFLLPTLGFRAKFSYFVFRVLHKLGLISTKQGRSYFPTLFKGLYEKEYAVVYEDYANHLMGLLKKEVYENLLSYKAQGYRVILVSAGLTPYLRPFAEELGVEVIASDLAMTDGVYAGSFKGIDCIGEGKVQKLKDSIDFNTIDWGESVAFGDSVSDIPLLSLVGRPHAVSPKKDLEEYARMHNWEIL